MPVIETYAPTQIRWANRDGEFNYYSDSLGKQVDDQSLPSLSDNEFNYFYREIQERKSSLNTKYWEAREALKAQGFTTDEVLKRSASRHGQLTRAKLVYDAVRKERQHRKAERSTVDQAELWVAQEAKRKDRLRYFAGSIEGSAQ